MSELTTESLDAMRDEAEGVKRASMGWILYAQRLPDYVIALVAEVERLRSDEAVFVGLFWRRWGIGFIAIRPGEGCAR